MVEGKKWGIAKFEQHELAFLLVLLALGLAFFASNAHLELGTDDIQWLQGEPSTVFDRYRHIPRFFFAALHTLFGMNAVAALAMIFTFHAINALLAYGLCRALVGSLVAARVTAFVFLVNPITLTTLTWISCFSYVLGTTLALVSLLAFWRGITGPSDRSRLWWLVALACYVAALFCSHEVLLLPLLFLLLCWLRGMEGWMPGLALFCAAMALGFLVQHFVYNFEEYGVETARLFSPGFVSALASSVFSFGAGLTLAYPLSFFVKPMEFLRTSFAEPMRWGVTTLLVAAAILSYRRSKAWRTWVFLAFSFVALITPYVFRLYLMPDTASYHISYVLIGRVFYLPFVVIAMALGQIVWQLSQRANVGLVLVPLVAMAYAHALLVLYDKTDFMMLQVLQGKSGHLPPSWRPYADGRPIWPASSVVVMTVAVALGFLLGKHRGPNPGSEAPNGDPRSSE